MIKRLSLITTCLVLSLFFANIKNSSNNEVVPTMTLPVSNKVIVLDAGHGTPDEGATSDNGVSEAEINLKIVLKLQKLLESSGSTILLTRYDENAIYELDAKTISEKKVSDIKNRVKIGNESSADIFVSVHLNKIPQKQYYGWQTFYKDKDDNSKNLATSIQNNLNTSINTENKRVPLVLNDIYIMKHVEIPICLVECGFLSNDAEESLLVTDEYQDKLAWGIYNGIMDYFYIDD